MMIETNPGRHYVLRVTPKSGDFHRYFLDKEGQWSICDNSGAYPEDTDDGALYVNQENPADYLNDFSPNGEPRCWVNLQCGSRSPCCQEEYHWLMDDMRATGERYAKFELRGAL